MKEGLREGGIEGKIEGGEKEGGMRRAAEATPTSDTNEDPHKCQKPISNRTYYTVLALIIRTF